MLEPDDPAEAAALDQAVRSRTRRPLARVRADWTRDGSFSHELADLSHWVDSVEVERSAASQLPTEVGLIDGYASAEATATLGGRDRNGRHVVEALSPWHESSPLFGRPKVTADLAVDLGLDTSAGAVLLRQFTGPVRSLKPDYTTRTVVLSALDPAERLRARVTLPTGSMTRPTFEANPRGYPWTTNSQWALDYVLRRNGVYASPPPPQQWTLFSATQHGSHVAEIATQTFAPRSDSLVGPYSGSYYRVEHAAGPHPFGMLAPMGQWDGAPSCQHICTRQLYSAPGTGFGFSVYGVFGEVAPRGDGSVRRIAVVLPHIDDRVFWDVAVTADGGMQLTYVLDGATEGSWTIGGDLLGGPPRWRDMSVHVAWRSSTEVEITFHSDGTTWFWDGPFSAAAPPTTDLRAAARLSVYHPIPVTNVALWESVDPPDGAWPNAGHTSQADLDVGLNEVTAIPPVVAADSWELIQDVTHAEYGLFGFDESGVPYFRNRDSLATEQAGEVVRELRTTASIKELATELNTDTIRNSVVWQARPSWLSLHIETVFEAETMGEFNSIPGVTVYEIPVPAGVIVGDGVNQVPHWSSEFWGEIDQQIIHGFAAQRGASGNDIPPGQDPPLVELYWELAGPRLGRLTVINRAGERINFSRAGSDADPTLRLGGSPIVEGVESVGEVTRPGSIAIHGQRGYEMRQSPWRQLTRPQARVAGSLVAALSSPVPVLEDVPVVGDPRLRIGDPVRLTDRDEFSVRGTVARTRQGASRSDGLYTVLSVRPLAPPGMGVLDDAARGRLDDTLVLAP